MQRITRFSLLSLVLVLAAVCCLNLPAQAAGDRLTVSGAIKSPSNKGIKEVEVEVLVNGRHVKPLGKDEEIVTGKQGTFMRALELPAGSLTEARVEVKDFKPSWEHLKPTPVKVVDAGADKDGNRVFQAASNFNMKRAITPAFWIATLILLGAYIIISFDWMHRTLAALLGAALIVFA